MKNLGLVFIFILIFLLFFVRADTSFFDNPDDFFIMSEISENGGGIPSGGSSGGGGSSGRIYAETPKDDEGKAKSIEEDRKGYPEEKKDELDIKNLTWPWILIFVLFILAVFVIFRVEKIFFRLINKWRSLNSPDSY